jgi:hypothetical protein
MQSLKIVTRTDTQAKDYMDIGESYEEFEFDDYIEPLENSQNEGDFFLCMYDCIGRKLTI